MTSKASVDRALAGTTCRDRLRQVLTAVDERGGVGPDVLPRLVEESVCPAGHDLHYASLMGGLIEVAGPGSLGLSRRGDAWLLDHASPSPTWRSAIAEGTPALRDWQDEALRAWCAHGRHGVIEAVTGTGKSRVGVEATREALADDFNVVIAVPTVDLVDQWLRTLRNYKVPGVGAVGNGKKATFTSHRVIVGTVQSLYGDPPTRPDGKVLVVADECHRYGAGQWRRVLDASYRRRLGLTATFERNDDGINDLLHYFGGGPVFTIGFPRAIADGVVARYDVKLLGVPLNRAERAEYDEAEEVLRDTRLQLLSADFPAEPFGAFLYEVQKAAEDDEDPTVTDVARRYLKAFSKRIDVMTNADAKITATRRLAPLVGDSGGSIVFTRRVEMAEDIAATLLAAGVRAWPIHSELTRAERHSRLSALKSGRVKALVAPTILDEGIDVPDIDLAVVMGGSRSRRQMIQRMGRVLRLKPDGRKATFVVVYAENTAEDLTRTDGAEGCLDLIIESADSVERLDLNDGTVNASDDTGRMNAPAGVGPQSTEERLVPATEAARVSFAVAPWPSPVGALSSLDAQTLPMTRRALSDFIYAHGAEEAEAEAALRRMLADFQNVAKVTPWPHARRAFALRHKNLELVVAPDRFIAYRSRRRDALTWDDLRHRSAASTQGTPHPRVVNETAVSGDPAALRILQRLDPDTCGVNPRAVRDYRRYHNGTEQHAADQLRLMLRDFQEECQIEPGKKPGIVLAGALGFQLVLNGHGIAGYHPQGRGDLTWIEARDLPPVFGEVHPPVDVADRNVFEQVPAMHLPLTVAAFAEVARDYRLLDDFAAGQRSFQRDLADINRERPEPRHKKDGSLLMRGTTVMVQVSPDGRRLIGVQRLRRSVEIDQEAANQQSASPTPAESPRLASQARSAESPEATVVVRPTPAGRTGSDRDRPTLTDLLAKDPAELLDVLDAESIAIDLAAVTRAAEAFDYGDPLTESALDSTRALLASDLAGAPTIHYDSGAFLLRGESASWTLRGDGQVVLGMAPHRAATVDADPPASAPPTPQASGASEETWVVVETSERPSGGLGGPLDLVSQIERLAALKDRGVLTEEEFSAAKARLLFP